MCICICVCISICICICICNCGKAVAWQQLINSALASTAIAAYKICLFRCHGTVRVHSPVLPSAFAAPATVLPD